MILILIKHTAANSAHGGQQENLITTDRLLCAMVLVTNYLSRISISIDLCIYSFSFRSLKRKNRCHSANTRRAKRLLYAKNMPKIPLCWFLVAWVLFLGSRNWMYVLINALNMQPYFIYSIQLSVSVVPSISITIALVTVHIGKKQGVIRTNCEIFVWHL